VGVAAGGGGVGAAGGGVASTCGGGGGGGSGNCGTGWGSSGWGGSDTGFDGSIVTAMASSLSRSLRWSGEAHHSASAVAACSAMASRTATGDIWLKREKEALTAWATVTPFYAAAQRAAS
jgi:hypothetical protein